VRPPFSRRGERGRVTGKKGKKEAEGEGSAAIQND